MNQKQLYFSETVQSKNQKQLQQYLEDYEEWEADTNQVSIQTTFNNTYEKYLDTNFKYLNDQYQLEILDKELEFYKKTINQKEKNIKIQKQKNGKIKKQISMQLENLKSTSLRLSKLKKDCKLLKEKQITLQKQEKIQQSERLNVQEQKNGIYQMYGQLQDRYQRAIREIQEFDGIEDNIESAEAQNQNLRKQIEDLSKKQKKGRNQQDRKKDLQQQINNQSKRIRYLQKQELGLSRQLQQIKRKQKDTEMLFNDVTLNNQELNRLYTNIAKLRNQLKIKYRQKQLREADYERICREEKVLRKQMMIQMNCKQAENKYKEKLNQPLLKIIIDSEGEDNNSHDNDRKANSKADLGNLIHKYEQLKEQNKQ